MTKYQIFSNGTPVGVPYDTYTGAELEALVLGLTGHEIKPVRSQSEIPAMSQIDNAQSQPADCAG